MSVMTVTTMADEPLKSGLNPADMNTSVKAGDDFYEYACGGWMKANPLPPAYSRFGSFDRLGEDNNKRINDILKELGSNTYTQGTIEQKLSDYYKLMDQQTLSREYYIKYLEKKEQMQAMRLSTVGEMNYIQQLRQEELKAEKMAARQRLQLFWLIFGSALLLILAGSALLLYRKNRQLLFSNQSLFRKNQEMMRAEETEHQLRKVFEQKLQLYHDNQQRLEQLSAEQIEEAHENEHAAHLSDPTSQPSPSTPQKKYSKSNLSDEQRATLIYRIQEALNNPDVICSNDFSLAKLAKIVGSNTAYVSQVINEQYEQTFSTVVGRYRIKEACRRINDTKNFGHLTLETISEGVGFKSRSTFINAFKRQVGLTPSEYIKMAAEDKET